MPSSGEFWVYCERERQWWLSLFLSLQVFKCKVAKGQGVVKWLKRIDFGSDKKSEGERKAFGKEREGKRKRVLFVFV